jgi:voltage-gated potassium channel
MIQQLLVALLLAGLTVVLHALGTVYIVLPLGGMRGWRKDSFEIYRPVWTLTRLVGLLLVVHCVEMAMWAAAYFLAGVFADFETCLYYSLKSYTTVGYGDVLPEKAWRLIGPLEAAVGVLMLGWSTSIIVAVMQRIYNTRFSPVAGSN